MDTNINNPIVSVIMPAYNAENYIQQAIDSVVSQTFHSWELIIVDDGSTDTTAEIVAKNINTDSRIKYFYQQNKRQSIARNLGISHAKGNYIAILDSDDVIMPERLTKQVAFLEANSEVVLCGSWFRIMGSDRTVKSPERHESIKVAMLNGNCIAHSSVMIRKLVLSEFSVIYDSSKEPSEDYDLYVRLTFKGKLHNLQEVLLDYRTHKSQLSKKQNEIQIKKACEIRRNLFNILNLNLTPTEEFVFSKVLNNGRGIDFSDITIFKQVKIKLLNSNEQLLFEYESFKNLILNLDKTIIKSCFLNRKQFSPSILFEYFRVKNEFNFKLKLKDECKLVIKSFIFFKTNG